MVFVSQSVSQSVSAYGGGWVEVVDVDNLGVTVHSGVPSGRYMLAYMANIIRFLSGGDG